MFTGLVEELGELRSLAPGQGGRELVIRAQKVVQGIRVGDSIMVNGACLTVTHLAESSFSVFVSQVTWDKTAFAQLGLNSAVHLERAMTPESRLDGHLVSGHIDTALPIQEIQIQGNTQIWKVSLPAEFRANVVPQGSIALHGVSLTLAQLAEDFFAVTLIPETLARTRFGHMREGDWLNAEFDMMGKYALRAARMYMDQGGDLSREKLAQSGF